MHHCTDTTPVCRGCGRELRGSPYWKGGRAYHPLGEKGTVMACHFGGWVCSKACDMRACREQGESMPGHGYGTGLSYDLRRKIEAKWEDTPDAAR